VLAGVRRGKSVPSTPSRLRAARTCYDHMAGTVVATLHDRLRALGWLSSDPKRSHNAYDVTLAGTKVFEALGIDLEGTRTLRRRFACACLDWSERRPHVGGALGAALLNIALKRKWVVQDLKQKGFGRHESRALRTTGAIRNSGVRNSVRTGAARSRHLLNFLQFGDSSLTQLPL
jgi:hypothetical protein